MNSFEQFSLSETMMKTLEDLKYTSPTAIQVQAIPKLLAVDKVDFVGLASTGTGKTAAFGIPLVEKIDASMKVAQALVLCPTRELAQQVSEQLKKLGSRKKLGVATIYGGASYRDQIRDVKKGATIIVATPGRLVDLLEQGVVDLTQIKTLILDEADEMLSMGFKEELESILKATHSADPDADEDTGKANCATWLFSATMNAQIKHLISRYLTNNEWVDVSEKKGVSKTVEHLYYTVLRSDKIEALQRILSTTKDFYGIIFCQTKMEVTELESLLLKKGFAVESLHGDKSQKDREFALKRFREGITRIVVATDVAARGLDVSDLSHVVNYSLPRDTESYVHRVGRTGRNGKNGVAISLVSPAEIKDVVRIQRGTGVQLTKAELPLAGEYQKFQIQKFMDQLTAVRTDGIAFQRAMDLFADWKLGSEELPFEELSDFLSRLFVTIHPELFDMTKDSLDFAKGRVPKELMAGGDSKKFKEGSEDRREGGRRGFGGGGGPRRRSNYEDRGERTEARSGGYSRGGERSERGSSSSEGRGFRRREEGAASSGEARPFRRRQEGASATAESRPRQFDTESRKGERKTPARFLQGRARKDFGSKDFRKPQRRLED